MEYTHIQQASPLTTCLWGSALLSLPLPPMSHNQPFGIPITPQEAVDSVLRARFLDRRELNTDGFLLDWNVPM